MKSPQVEAEIPQFIQSIKGQGGIPAPPAQAPSRRNFLPDPDLGTAGVRKRLLEQPGRSQNEVVLVPRDGRVRTAEPDLPVRQGKEIEGIAEVDGLEEGPDFMVTIFPPAQYLDPQVDLGKRPGLHPRDSSPSHFSTSSQVAGL